jgi:hypothetical protein
MFKKHFSLLLPLTLVVSFHGEDSLAHHSGVMFDNNNPITLTGMVREFQWHNPHTYIQLVLSDSSGQEKEWSIEMAAPMYLYNMGWRPSTLKQGDTISVDIFPLKSGEPAGLVQEVRDSEGKRIGAKP